MAWQGVGYRAAGQNREGASVCFCWNLTASQVPVCTPLHWIDKGAAAQRVRHLPKVTQPARIKVVKAQALPRPPLHSSQGPSQLPEDQ